MTKSLARYLVLCLMLAPACNAIAGTMKLACKPITEVDVPAGPYFQVILGGKEAAMQCKAGASCSVPSGATIEVAASTPQLAATHAALPKKTFVLDSALASGRDARTPNDILPNAKSCTAVAHWN